MKLKKSDFELVTLIFKDFECLPLQKMPGCLQNLQVGNRAHKTYKSETELTKLTSRKTELTKLTGRKTELTKLTGRKTELTKLYIRVYIVQSIPWRFTSSPFTKFSILVK